MTREELITLLKDLVEHLEYCGWGDNWEREVSEPLRQRVQQFLAEEEDVTS